MFVAGAVVVGGIIITHGNHSDSYSCHSQHSNHRDYGDSGMVSQINDLKSRVSQQEIDIEEFREGMQKKLDKRIAALRKEGKYEALSSTDNINHLVEEVKDEMKKELEDEIKKEREELATIDKMIARINELELQATGKD